MSRRVSHGPSPQSRSEDWIVIFAVVGALLVHSVWSLIVAIAVIGLAWNLNQAASLRRRLRSKGYDWVTLEDAQYLCQASDKKSLARLPDRAEVESSPGYVAGNAECLSALAATLERQRPSPPGD